MNRGANLVFNFVTLLFLLATGVVCVSFFAIASDEIKAPVFAPKATEIPPTLVPEVTLPPLPSFTPSRTPFPSRTPTPTFTPSWTSTPTRTPTLSLTPSLTPSITNTFTPSPTNTLIPPTRTPTRTPTYTPVPTATPTNTPPGPTPEPTSTYPFRVQPSSLILRENYANTAGCNWQGIAGQVTTETGEPVIGIQVRVVGDNIGEVFTVTGTNTFYGPSGWEVVLDSAPNMNEYEVALFMDGKQLSPPVRIVFPGQCQNNLATMNFIQTRPF